MAHWDMDNRRSRICRIPIPRLSHFKEKARDAGVYVSGALFALGWWFFIDAVIYSGNWNYDRDGYKEISVEFVDWVPGICSTIGMIMINCIDKAALRGDSFSFSDSGSVSIVWKARVFLFIGFTFMAGGFAGSVSVMCVKYLVPGYGDPYAFWGICNVVQNTAIMISAALLWVVQNTETDEFGLSI